MPSLSRALVTCNEYDPGVVGAVQRHLRAERGTATPSRVARRYSPAGPDVTSSSIVWSGMRNADLSRNAAVSSTMRSEKSATFGSKRPSADGVPIFAVAMAAPMIAAHMRRRVTGRTAPAGQHAHDGTAELGCHLTYAA